MGSESLHKTEGAELIPPSKYFSFFHRVHVIKRIAMPLISKQRIVMSSTENSSDRPNKKRTVFPKLFFEDLVRRREEEVARDNEEDVWKEYRKLSEKARENPNDLVQCKRCISPVVKMENYGRVCSHILSSLLK